MKVLLIKDVYKLGHAGDVKKVAAGYGRNYLIPQGLAVIATPGALKHADRIRADAAKQRAVLNQEMSGVAEQVESLTLTFPARAGETGKLYGSITTRMIAGAISDELGIELDHRQVDTQPLRMIGRHSVNVRLTVDLVPEIEVIVYREGESAEMAIAEIEAGIEVEEEIESSVEGEPAAEAEETTAVAEVEVESLPLAEDTASVEDGAESEAPPLAEEEADVASEAEAEPPQPVEAEPALEAASEDESAQAEDAEAEIE